MDINQEMVSRIKRQMWYNRLSGVDKLEVLFALEYAINFAPYGARTGAHEHHMIVARLAQMLDEKEYMPTVAPEHENLTFRP